MRLQELFGTRRKLPGKWADIKINRLTADSRQVEPGFLFAALPGSAVDGAKFIPRALAEGAVAVIAGRGACNSDMGGAALIEVSNPRRELALAAARFYGRQPQTIAAITGTNGKTSVASFLRQLWAGDGLRAANFGTTGIHGPEGEQYLGLTTPDPVTLHKVLYDLAGQGVSHVALEASSHGLEQNRLDGVHISAAAFTNISRDHLDYHKNFEDYFAQKLRLFEELLPPGAPVVVDVEAAGAERIVAIAKERGSRLFSVGRGGDDLALVKAVQNGFGYNLSLECDAGVFDFYLPLTGEFQISNALVAAGLAIVCGGECSHVLPGLENLHGACGRLELAGKTSDGAPVFVDYAHTPDALENALGALRPYVERRLVVVFGAGGDRDKGKRPLMGEIAARLADRVIVTDDNPRFEEPGFIRSQILDACPGATEIAARGEAIENAVAGLEKGDVLLVAGKGHERGQIIGDDILPFNDHSAVHEAIAKGLR